VRDALIVSVLSLIPRNHVTRVLGWCARWRLPAFLERWLLAWFIRHYRVNTDELEMPVSAYPSLEAFFTRRLKDGARPLCPDKDAVVSPADAVLVAAGRVCRDRIPQSGSQMVDVRRLLGGDHPFEGGAYAVLYLSPPDYHRVHSPVAGAVARWHYVPGTLFPVFRASAERVENLFARNERLVTWLDTAVGRVALVMVGAFGVGRITTPYMNLVTNTGGRETDVEPDKPPTFDKGAEIGCFHLGSTVILFFEPDKVQIETAVGKKVKVNARIGGVVG